MPNTITFPETTETQDYACGQLFEYICEEEDQEPKVYILARTPGQWALVNLQAGNTYDGFRDSISEAFGGDYSKFIRITSPVTLTPQS